MPYSIATQELYSWKYKSTTTNNGNAVPAYSPDRSGIVRLPGTKSGEKMLNWRGKIRKGLNAATPYTRYAQKVEVKSLRDFNFSVKYQSYAQDPYAFPVAYYWQNWRTFDFAGNWVKPINNGTYGHLAVDLAKANATALKRTYNKVLQEQQHLNSLAVLAEFGDVVRQFGAPFSSVVKLTNRHLSRLTKERRRLKGGPRFRDEKWHEIVASSYLEYVFGLEPLISDTKVIAEAFARWQYEKTGEASFRTAIKGRGEESAASTTTSYESDDGLTTFKVVTKVTTVGRVQYTCGLGRTIIAPFGSNERLLQLLGITPRNIVPALWEAVPWSWLIDYATNIGDIITATCASTADVKWVVKSVTRRTLRDNYAAFDEAQTRKILDSLAGVNSANRIDSMLGNQVGQYRHVITSLERTVPANLGIPPLVLSFDPSLKQYANLLAVMIQMRKSWKRFSVPSQL